MSVWKTLDIFQYENEAQPLIDILTQNNLVFYQENITSTFDPTFVGNEVLKRIAINVKTEDYEKANQIWQEALRESEWYDVHYQSEEDFLQDTPINQVPKPKRMIWVLVISVLGFIILLSQVLGIRWWG